ncbi:glutaredoxin family protein [Microbacterium sp. 3H14]|uniref:glutaredoxin family protein n=2 Tax=Microbacteriaceae TaxID=85023 RepID=UPI00106C3965|nr:glutaredoxin family protein [Microbacterium sp. 3H14]TFB17103.1 glutaredoxin family protein [Microbacterium sp. 3H14]
MTTLTLIRKPDCHLCEVASEVIDAVVAELPDAAAEQIEIVEASINDDPALYELWWEKIPVLLIDGELHAHWRVTPDRLREALETAVRSDVKSESKEALWPSAMS